MTSSKQEKLNTFLHTGNYDTEVPESLKTISNLKAIRMIHGRKIHEGLLISNLQ